LKDGKKEISKRLDLIPDNRTYVCNHCGQVLVKLHSELGEAEIVEGIHYRPFYWICLCTNEDCPNTYKEVKVLERNSEVKDYPSKGRYMDRSRTSGR
jgi:hypothetical protein